MRPLQAAAKHLMKLPLMEPWDPHCARCLVPSVIMESGVLRVTLPVAANLG